MMPEDDIEHARGAAAAFEKLPVSHAWDPERYLGDLYSRTLGLNSIAWDVYLLYPPGVRWDGENPPHPTFWMHQLPAASTTKRDLVLYPNRLSQELLAMLDKKVAPLHTGLADLGLQLHGKGLTTMLRERSQYTLEDIKQAVNAPKRQRE